MNAQTLIDTTPSSNFEFSTFWKSNHSQQNKCMAVDKKPSTQSSSGSHKLNLQQREEESADNFNSSQVNSFNNFDRGDKRFVARSGNIEYHQVSQAKGLSHSPFSLKPTKDSFPTDNSLTPRTLNYTKVKKARSNLQVENDFKDLGIEVL